LYSSSVQSFGFFSHKGEVSFRGSGFLSSGFLSSAFLSSGSLSSVPLSSSFSLLTFSSSFLGVASSKYSSTDRKAKYF